MAPSLSEHMRRRVSHVEDTEATPVPYAHDDEIGMALHGLVDDCRTGLPRLQQARLNGIAVLKSQLLSTRDNLLRVGHLLLQRSIKRQAPFDLYHIHSVYRGSALLSEPARKPNHFAINTVAAHRNQHFSDYHTAEHLRYFNQLSQYTSSQRQRQKAGLTSAIAVTNSSLPTSMHNVSTSFPAAGMNA